ncbi:MAG: TonB-dependent receptor, partial [Pseudomonadota bacterium]
MPRFRISALAALIPAAGLAPASAQEAVELAPIVLSGGLTPIDAESYGRAYSIVTREELEARQI